MDNEKIKLRADLDALARSVNGTLAELKTSKAELDALTERVKALEPERRKLFAALPKQGSTKAADPAK